MIIIKAINYTHEQTLVLELLEMYHISTQVRQNKQMLTVCQRSKHKLHEHRDLSILFTPVFPAYSIIHLVE